MKAAEDLGTALARANIALVYGGGSIGLMGQVARAVLKAGGHVTGIIPEFLMNKERMQEGVNELIVTSTMHERKTIMFERSTGFVAMPGGIGTLEELAEIATWGQLKQHAKPLIICDVAGYWSHLLAMIDHMRGEAFIRSDAQVFFHTAKTVEDIVPLYHEHCGEVLEEVPLLAVRNKL